ncbi:MAG: MotA/TolQ/ExbB proton channel family protein [Planctomycetes bacterium]|nr:MotA/TolQ/ExbB proton channel family protein [Planctomycetota bacterium]
MSLGELLERGGPVLVPIFAVSLLIWWLGLGLWFALGRAEGPGDVRRSLSTLEALKTLTGTAPFLGLLGTVGGMMLAFDGLVRFGPGNLRGLSHGIARALVTTQAGLLVALTGMLFLVVLQSRLRRLEAVTTPPRCPSRRPRRRSHG